MTRQERPPGGQAIKDAVNVIAGRAIHNAETVLSIRSPKELPAEWYFLWQERAAIMEYNRGMTKEDADVAAFENIVRQMRQSWISHKDA